MQNKSLPAGGDSRGDGAFPFPAGLLFATAAVLWGALIDWRAPLSEMHDFRQSQTALSAYWMMRDGLDLWHPPLPVFGLEHPSAPFEFPLYQYVLAAIARLLDLSGYQAVVITGRAVNFAAFLLTGYALLRLARLCAGVNVALIATALFLLMPYPVFWATGVSIEYAALGATLFFFEASWRVMMLEDRRLATLLGGTVAGIGAMLIKITTALVYGPAIFLLWLAWIRRQASPRPWLWLAAVTLLLAIVPLACGVAWTRWSDAIKAASPVTQFLSSADNMEWNYGTLAQRLSPLVWMRIFGFWTLQILAVTGIPLAAAGLVCGWRHNRLTLILLATIPLAATLVFTNLYQRHNYYSIALLPSFTILLAMGVMALSRRVSPLTLTAALIALSWCGFLAAAQLAGIRNAQNFVAPFRGTHIAASDVRRRDLTMVAMIGRHGQPDDVIMIVNGDWKPVVPFFSEHKALMPQHCGQDLRETPRFGLVIIDTKNNICPDISIPVDCLLEEKDGLQAGRCITLAGRRLGLANPASHGAMWKSAEARARKSHVRDKEKST